MKNSFSQQIRNAYGGAGRHAEGCEVYIFGTREKKVML